VGKTVTLKIKSELCEEEITVPEELWKRFEARAKKLEIPVEELFPMVIDAFLKSKGY